MRCTFPKLFLTLPAHRMTRFVALSLIVFVLAACQTQTPQTEETYEVQDQRPVVVLYAFSPEGAQLREWAMIRTDTMFAGRRLAVGWLGMPVVIAGSGMGMTNAAAATQYVIDTFDPIAIVFTGICGAVSPDHAIGDIVIPDHWVTHDYGYWGGEGLEVDSITVGNPDSVGLDRILKLPVDTMFHRQIAEAANSISYRFKQVGQRLPEVHIGGAGVSGNAFIDSKSKRTQLHEILNAEIVDMESAAVVQTARASGVPAVVVRSCSDLAGGSGSETATDQLEQFFEVAAYNSALVVRQFLERER